MDQDDKAQGGAAPLFRPAVVSLIDPVSGQPLGLHVVHPDSLHSDRDCLEAAQALYDVWKAANPQMAEVDTTELDVYVFRR